MRAIETSPGHSDPLRPPVLRCVLTTASIPLGCQVLVATLCGALAFSQPAAAQIVIEPSARLEVLSYNAWLLNVPSPLDLFGPDAPCYNGRGRSIGRTLRTNHDFDLVLLQESFDDGARDRMLDELDGKYPYVVQKQPGGSLLGDLNGGLTILSKHPFLSLAPMWIWPNGIPATYHAAEWKLPNGDDLCAGADCLANKGFLHVRISVGGATISVINLHTDADDPGSNHLYIRYPQMLQLREYLRDIQSYFPSDLLLVGGDFNIKSPCSLGCVDCAWSIEYDVTLPWLFEEPSGVDLPAREAWREEACAPLGGGAVVWGPGADGSDGRTSTCEAHFPGDCSASSSDKCEPAGSTKAHRLDLLMFNDSHGASILRTSNVRVERFGQNPPPTRRETHPAPPGGASRRPSRSERHATGSQAASGGG
jgi:hypothetical protein